MTQVSSNEIKVGSIVTFRGRVTDVASNIRHANVMLDGDEVSTLVLISSFLTVENPPEPLRVGDFVRARGNGNTGLLKAIDGHDAWIAFSPAHHTTIPLSHLERAISS